MNRFLTFTLLICTLSSLHAMSDPEHKQCVAVQVDDQVLSSSSFFTKRDWSAFNVPSSGYPLPCAAFSPDGSTLAFSMNLPRNNHSPYFYDMSANCLLQHPVASRNMTTTMTFSPDGSMFAFGRTIDNTHGLLTIVPAYDFSRGIWMQHEPSLLQSPLTAMQFSPDGSTLALAGKDGSVKIWDVAQNSCKTVLRAKDTEPTHAIAYLYNNAVCFNDAHGGIIICDTRGRTSNNLTYTHFHMIRAIAASMTRNILVSGCQAGLIRFADFRNLRDTLVSYREYNSPTMSLALHPDYAEALAGYYNGRVDLYSSMGKSIGSCKKNHRSYVTAVTLSASQHYWAASTSQDGQLTIYGNKTAIQTLAEKEYKKHKTV